METMRASVAVVMRQPPPPLRVRGVARETTPANDSMPYQLVVDVKVNGRWTSKVRSYQHGRDALARARKLDGARVYYVAPRTEHLDYADQLLPMNDKAKPPKGSCGAFCSGQTTKVVAHHVEREMIRTRIY